MVTAATDPRWSLSPPTGFSLSLVLIEERRSGDDIYPLGCAYRSVSIVLGGGVIIPPSIGTSRFMGVGQTNRRRTAIRAGARASLVLSIRKKVIYGNLLGCATFNVSQQGQRSITFHPHATYTMATTIDVGVW